VRATRLSALDYTCSLWPGCESSDLDPISTITAHCLGSVVTQLRGGRLLKVQETWAVRLEVCGFSREGGRGQPQFREAASTRLFRRGRSLHILEGRGETVGENLSVRIRSQRRHGVIG